MTGTALEPVLPELGAAIREGLINPDQVRSIVDAMTGLGDRVDVETRDLAEHLMVEAASVTPPTPFARFCRLVASQLDQDGDLPVDTAHDRVTLSLGRRNNRTGLTPLTGQLDDLGVEMLGKALDGLSTPRPSTECGPDPRPGAVRRGQAFQEMLRRFLDVGQAPTDHGVRPHIAVTMTIDGLDQAFDDAIASGALFDSGVPITVAMLRQLLCDADILPVVLGGDGSVLDVGRERRTFPVAMHKAIVVRDRGCTWPGCDRPASFCQAHHVDWWAAMFGRTAVDNGALLCAHHHSEIHKGQWKMRMSGGRPEFLAPEWIDPNQQWQRNKIHHLRPHDRKPPPRRPDSSTETG